MTPPQKVLLRYWLTGLAVLLMLLWLGAQLHWRLQLLPALIIIVLIDKTLRPPRPTGVLTSLQLVRNSRAWRRYFSCMPPLLRRNGRKISAMFKFTESANEIPFGVGYRAYETKYKAFKAAEPQVETEEVP